MCMWLYIFNKVCEVFGLRPFHNTLHNLVNSFSKRHNQMTQNALKNKYYTLEGRQVFLPYFRTKCSLGSTLVFSF